MVKGIKDFEFQNDCVNFLIQKTVERDSKKVITVKAPTGAGKTIILIKYIDEYLNNTDNNTAFVPYFVLPSLLYPDIAKQMLYYCLYCSNIHQYI